YCLLLRYVPDPLRLWRKEVFTRRRDDMKAVRLLAYNELPKVQETAEPTITSPTDVIVRIGGAGLCRTDLHIIEGQWVEKSGVTLPYTLGHENAGWVEAIGSAVSNVAVGDTVIVHPLGPVATVAPAVPGMISIVSIRS